MQSAVAGTGYQATMGQRQQYAPQGTAAQLLPGSQQYIPLGQGKGIQASVQTSPPGQDKSEPLLEVIAPYIAEFIGTFLLVFTVGCCSIIGEAMWNPTAIGCVLMVSIYAFGPVSGGNLNPAVSLALGLSKKLPWKQVAIYSVMQIAAGVIAGCCFAILLGKSVPLSQHGFEWWDVGIAEVIYTMMICFVVNNCAASKRNNPSEDGNQFFALAIGFVIIAGGYAVGNISGACFNPAVSLGLSITSYTNLDGLLWGFAYTGFQIVGACLAAAFFYVCRPEEFRTRAGGAELPIGFNFSPPLSAMCASEFLGTFILTFTVGMNVVMGSDATAWSAAASLMCMIYSLGDVSGGHFNPAVTLAVVCSRRGKCSPARGLCFVAAQVAAGTLAGCLFAHFHAVGPNKDTSFGLPGGLKGEKYTWHQIEICEFAFTALLAFVVLSVATVTPQQSRTTRNFQFALAIGSCVTVGGIAIGGISGGELNPAVSFGLATSNLISPGNMAARPWISCLFFSLFELLGGLAAAVVFRLTHTMEYKPKDNVLLL